MDIFFVNEKFKDILLGNGINSAAKLWELKGEDAKKKTKARQIEKIILQDKNSTIEFYLKRYNPIPLLEILKNKITFKPVFTDGAIHEWNAVHAFEKTGIPAPKAVAVAKFANGRSCILTLGIQNYIRASDFLSSHETPSGRRHKVIKEIAKIAGRMHSANIAHQDLYLLHFFVVPDENYKVYLIDLQRVIISKKTLPNRWHVKDLAQLLFSARKILSEQDILLFRVEYEKYVSKERINKLCGKISAKANRLEKRNKNS